MGTLDPLQIVSSNLLAETISARIACTIAGKPTAMPSQALPALVIPYCEGEVLAKLNGQQAFKLGYLLAQLHALNLPPLKESKAFPKIHLPKGKSVPMWVLKMMEQCNSKLQFEENCWVVSHRDMHLNNIIWQDSNTPHLIDWESAGLIHPFVELIGLASNASGLAQCQFDADLFRSTLEGYGSLNQRLPPAQMPLWELSAYSWLLWYVFVLEEGQFNEAERTLQSLDFIMKKTKDLIDIYKQMECHFHRKQVNTR
ncbi:putative aminoglycoside phosphotransferase [Legionella jordanis]|uniref:Putative aminoglycoside phosphotransferase n=1 Tax=Legionella jordanis TaxID=456 RepID=A0A0W0VEZ5_9GAMM|nr:putative aminoglycoside phosphotransferase [Legionella jordanis]VEH13690.1 putative aminoglycoside phosphotransferase [Legionella jordanis]